MKKFFLAIAALFVSAALFAQDDFYFTEASDLTIVGKVFPDTPNPYERMDFTKYGGWDPKDINLLEMSAGVIVSFRTDSPEIAVKPVFKEIGRGNASGFATRGFDLYIKKDGKWLWAGVCAYSTNPDRENGKVRTIVKDMDETVKECILYLPNFSKEISVGIGIKKGSMIEKGAVPFRHRICLHGSSFMHGSSTGRAGQTVPGYLTRMTGMQFCSLGVSGDCKMQPQFANALKDADVDAFVFDSFSNGSDKTVEANLFNFIETIQAAKPGVPMIFMRTIWREKRNFNKEVDEAEAKKYAKAEELMAKAVKKYKDVYFISSNATSDLHETTVDGTHPGDWGYWLWADSVRKPILKILAKYGIK